MDEFVKGSDRAGCSFLDVSQGVKTFNSPIVDTRDLSLCATSLVSY